MRTTGYAHANGWHIKSHETHGHSIDVTVWALPFRCPFSGARFSFSHFSYVLTIRHTRNVCILSVLVAFVSFLHAWFHLLCNQYRPHTNDDFALLYVEHNIRRMSFSFWFSIWIPFDDYYYFRYLGENISLKAFQKSNKIYLLTCQSIKSCIQKKKKN